jgi:pyruvate, orthophosphate dikinase
MVPLVSTVEEFNHQEQLIRTTATETMKAYGGSAKVEYRVGTMIETPRAALMSGEIAKTAQFFSFGTNDLTQMTYGLSRDDVAKFLPLYLNEKIFPADPFQVCALPASPVCPESKGFHSHY